MTSVPVGPRLQKRGLFRLLGYEPHPGQDLVHRSLASRRVLACGVRWGKTVCAAHEAVAALLEPREQTLGWVVGPTYGHSGRIFELVVLAFERHLSHRLREVNRRQQELLVQNLSGGISKLCGKSADNPSSLLGDGIDFLIVDEAAQIERAVWETGLSQRLLDKRGWALLASTPHGRDWFYRQWRRGQKGRDTSYASWQSPSFENPHLDRALIEAERKRLGADAFAEQYEAAFLGPDLEPCELCGGPDRRLPWAIYLRDGEELLRCPDCRRAVDASGRTRAGARRMLIVQGRDTPTSWSAPEVEERLAGGIEGPISVLNGTLAAPA